MYSCLSAHGKLLACGNNEDYQLGVDVDVRYLAYYIFFFVLSFLLKSYIHNDEQNTTRFSRVLGLDKEVVTSIAAGAEHSCAITGVHKQ